MGGGRRGGGDGVGGQEGQAARPHPTNTPRAPPLTGSDGWFYAEAAATKASLREIVHDGFLHPRDNK